MRIRYINVKTSQGIETIDELHEKDFPNRKAFHKELWQLKEKYALAYRGTGLVPYTSQRPTKDWKDT